jgi:hypothetical protein
MALAWLNLSAALRLKNADCIEQFPFEDKEKLKSRHSIGCFAKMIPWKPLSLSGN